MKNHIRIIFFFIMVIPLLKISAQVIPPSLEKIVDRSSLIVLAELLDIKNCVSWYNIPNPDGKTGNIHLDEDGFYFTFKSIKLIKGSIQNPQLFIYMTKKEYHGSTEIPFYEFKTNQRYILCLNPRLIPAPDSIKMKYNLSDTTNYFPYFEGFGVIDMHAGIGDDHQWDISLQNKTGEEILAQIETLCVIIPPPPSAGTTSSQLADSLGIKLDTYASSSSIGNDKFVENLKKQIKQIQTHIQKGKKDKAIEELKKFREKLHNVYFKIGGQDQRFITPETYGYLYYTAQYIIDLLNSENNGGSGIG